MPMDLVFVLKWVKRVSKFGKLEIEVESHVSKLAAAAASGDTTLNEANHDKAFGQRRTRHVLRNFWSRELNTFSTPVLNAMIYYNTCVGVFFSNGPTPATFFVYFRFSKHKFYINNSWCQQDSNSDHWRRRRACWPLDHHHGPVPM